MVPTRFRRFFVSNMDNGAAEATLRRNWCYTLCLCGQRQRMKRGRLPYQTYRTTYKEHGNKNITECNSGLEVSKCKIINQCKIK